MLILQKKRAGIPVIIMGETGCGKTFLLKYIAEVLYDGIAEFFSFTMYYGVKESHFVEFVDDIIEVAEKNPEKDIWIFFDEFNTSELQSSICELMNDRTFSITNLDRYKGKYRVV
jgi:MoxR-like ATPase